MLGQRWFLVSVVLCAFLGSPASARAASGLYLQLGGGYGDWTGNELVTREAPGAGDIPATGDGCCPSGTLSAQLRVGFSIFKTIAPEVFVFGSGWNLGDSDPAGGGFAGGGLRFFPLGLLENLEIIEELEEIPFDFSLGVGGAFAISGSDAFGYEGFAVGVDATAEWIAASFFSVGVKLDVWLPTYDAFATTSRSANRGRCLDDMAMQVFDENVGPGGVISRSDAGNLCPSDGRGPNTTVISPQIIMTFRFDVFD